MRIRKEYVILAAIFMAVFLFRVYFAFNTATFSPESYFDTRQIINIRFFGLPIFQDELSFSGRQFFFMPLFHYLIAGLSFLFPLQMVLKIAPNFFASLTVIIAYLIAFELTKDKTASLAASLAAGIVPVLALKTINTVSAYSLAIPLFFFLIYCIMKIEERIYVWLFISGFLFITFLHPISLLLITGLLFYIAMIKLEQIKYDAAEAELILFATLLGTWLTFLFFKTPLLVHGSALVWQNIPKAILEQHFASFDILQEIFRIGVIPFMAGLFVIYKYMLRQHVKDVYLFMSFALAILLLLWLKLIKIEIGLIFLGVIFSILFAQFVKESLIYLESTRFSHHKRIFVAAIFALIIITSGIPALQLAKESVSEAPSEEKVKALLWLKTNSKSDSVVLAPVEEGHLISGIAQRKNIADTNFLLVKDAEIRTNDIDAVYSTPYKIEAIKILNKHNADYIFLSRSTVQYYAGEALKYANDKNCFELVLDSNEVQIYKSLCRV